MRIQATMPIKDESEYPALFAFIHRLVKEEGVKQRYAVSSSTIQMMTDIDVSEDGREVGRSFADAPFDTMTLPELIDERNYATASPLGVELTSPSKKWIKTWYRRWADFLDRPPIATFMVTEEVDKPETSGYARLFRAIHWMFKVATLDDDSYVQVDWRREGAKRRQWKTNEKVKPCPNCKVKLPDKMCERIVAFVDHPAKSMQNLRVALEYGYHTAAMRVGKSKVHIKTTKIGEIDSALDLWDEIQEKPWDIEPRDLEGLGKARTKLRTEIRFDERGELNAILEVVHRLILEEGIEENYQVFSSEGPVGRGRAGEEAHNVEKRIRWARGLTFELPPLRSLERSIGLAEGKVTLASAAPDWDADWIQTWVDNFEAALRRPLAADFVQDREVQLYPEVNYFFLFKGLAWLMQFRGEAKSLRFLLRNPDERYDLPFSGPNERCESTGLELPKDLAVDLVNCAFLDRFVLLSIDTGEAELEFLVVERKVRVTGSDADFCQEATAAWEEIERKSIGDP